MRECRKVAAWVDQGYEKQTNVACVVIRTAGQERERGGGRERERAPSAHEGVDKEEKAETKTKTTTNANANANEDRVGRVDWVHSIR